jgi:hypothetical protein
MQRKIESERIDAMISHAKWAGKRLATILHSGFEIRHGVYVRSGLDPEMLAEQKWVNTTLRLMGVQELLVPYAKKIAFGRSKEISIGKKTGQ